MPRVLTYREWAEDIHARNLKAGWWTDINTGKPLARNWGEMFGLVHTEVSEALEGHRTNAKDKHLPHRLSIEVELADAKIRIFDMAGSRDMPLDRPTPTFIRVPPEVDNVGERITMIHAYITFAYCADGMVDISPQMTDILMTIDDLGAFLGLDLEAAMIEKLEFNANRPDHKIENRLKEGGKKI